jgi:hypothetical protein
MLDQNAIHDPKNVRRNPVNGLAEAREAPVHDDELTFRHDRSGLIFECRREALDEIEQAFTTGSDVRTVLDVVR